MLGSGQDINSLNNLMQNPAVSQMMQSLLSNPQYMNQVRTSYLIQDVAYGIVFTVWFCISCASRKLGSLTSLNFQILGLNPQLRGMLDSNSQLREMMQNPEFLRQLTSPETMQVYRFIVLQLLTYALALVPLGLPI